MKVVLVCGSYPPMRCGVGDYTRRLAEGLAAAGVEVTVLTSHAAGSRNLNGVQVRAEMHRWRLADLPQLLWLLDETRPDLVHVQYPSVGYERGLAVNRLPRVVRQRGMRTVLTLHEFQRYTWRGRWRLAPTLAHSQVVICTSHAERRELRKRIPASTRLEVIHLGSNLRHHGAQVPVTVPTPHPDRLAHFGTVMPNKGWETLLPALQRLKHQGHPVQLRVVGELEPDRYAYHRQVQAAIRSAGLEAEVHFTGYAAPERAREYLAECAAAVLPFTAGVSLNRSSLIAVLAEGLPLVTTLPTEPLEHLHPGKSFLGVPAGDSRALALGLSQVLEDPGLRQALRQGAQAAAAWFAWPRIVQRHADLYQRLLTEQA